MKCRKERVCVAKWESVNDKERKRLVEREQLKEHESEWEILNEREFVLCECDREKSVFVCLWVTETSKSCRMLSFGRDPATVVWTFTQMTKEMKFKLNQHENQFRNTFSSNQGLILSPGRTSSQVNLSKMVKKSEDPRFSFHPGTLQSSKEKRKKPNTQRDSSSRPFDHERALCRCAHENVLPLVQLKIKSLCLYRSRYQFFYMNFITTFYLRRSICMV